MSRCLIRSSIAAAGAVAALVLTPVAGADTIVYVHASDASLWVAQPDGSDAHQINTGPMEWPSESSTGTIVAQGPGITAPDGTSGANIYVMDGKGNVDHQITTPADYSTLSCPTYAPQHVHISPDGSKIAYDVFVCNQFTTFWTPTASTGLNWPGQTAGQEGSIVPSWVGNTQMLLSYVEAPVGAEEFATYDAGNGDNTQAGWFSDSGWPSGWRAYASTDGQRIAVVEDDAANYLGTPSRVAIKLYSAAGPPPTPPSSGCEVDIPFGAGYANVAPSFSSDDRHLLFGEPDGLHVADVSDPTNCAGLSAAPLVVPGGTQGFWSSAPEADFSTPALPSPNPPGPPPPVGHPHAVISAPAKVRAHRKAAFSGAKSSDTAATIVTYKWSFGDGTRASGRKVSHAFKRPGHYTVTLTVIDTTGRRATIKSRVTVNR
jgi:hypothetical protein